MQKPTLTESDDEDEDLEPGPSFFQGALKSVFELEKRKALLAPSDLVGILIYNTVSTCTSHVTIRLTIRPNATQLSPLAQAKLPENESEDANGMYTLAKLSAVSIDQVKDLKELVDGQSRCATPPKLRCPQTLTGLIRSTVP